MKLGFDSCLLCFFQNIYLQPPLNINTDQSLELCLGIKCIDIWNEKQKFASQHTALITQTIEAGLSISECCEKVRDKNFSFRT